MENATEEVKKKALHYCGRRDFKERRRVFVEVDKIDLEDDDETSLTEFYDGLAEIIKGVPEEHLANAVVREHVYEGSASLTIGYARQETEEEWADTMRRALTWAREDIEKDRRYYEALKAKYEGA
jgi:hypothetical protein